MTKRYGGLDDEAVLKKMPRGLTVTDPKLPAILAKEFAGLLPLVRWLNAALGLPQ